MKTWRGIAGDVSALSDGAQFIRNSSFDIEGEMRRRIALERTLSQDSQLGLLTYGPPSGGQYAVIVQSDGTVQVVSA